MTTETKQRGQRRTLTGVVTSTKMAQTLTVQIQRTFKHAKYKKYVRRSKKVHVHDPKGEAKIGDTVEIVACRPISKIVRWRLVGVVTAALDRGVEVAAAASTGLAEESGGDS
jgi:small subunit ribosomal protein S17